MVQMTPTLAVSDFATYAMFTVSTLVSLVVGGGLTLLFRSHDALRSDIAASEAKRISEVSDISDKLHDANTKLLDERDRRISHSMANQAQSAMSAMNAFGLRIDRVETQAEKLTTVRADAELSLVKAIGELRTFVRDCAPSRKEFEHVTTSVSDLTKAVTQLERSTASRDDVAKIVNDALRHRGGSPQ